MTKYIAVAFGLTASVALAQADETALLRTVRKNLNDGYVTWNERTGAERATSQRITDDDGTARHAKAAIAVLDTLNDADLKHVASFATEVYRDLADVLAAHGNVSDALDVLLHARVSQDRLAQYRT